MGVYARLGSCLLVSELARDPFGVLHRAVAIAGDRFERHLLVRTFSEEMLQAGMSTRLAEAGRMAALLDDAKRFGLGFRIEGGKTPLAACDLVPGRSLAQVLGKAKQEQIPLGIEHALTVIQGVAHGIVQMHAKGVSHGVLSPHSVWVAFEGTTQIIDAPFASLAQGMLGQAPAAGHKLAPYLQGPDHDAFQKDLFALGALFYELLTFETLPLGGDLPALLDRATLKATHEETPLPAEVRAFLGRLLLGLQPFPSMEAFNAELEHMLFGGEYSPAAFDVAFLMHTLFREENDRDTAAMKAEQEDDYHAYTSVDAASRRGATRIEHMDGQAELQEPKSEAVLVKTAAMLIGGLLLVTVLLGLGYLFFSRQKDDPAIQKQLAELQQLKLQIEQQKANLDTRSKTEGETTAQLQKQLSETKSVDEKAKIQKQLEEAQQRRLDLERQQKAAEQRLTEQRLTEQKLTEQRQAEQRQATEGKGTVPQPPVAEVPRPQAVPERPKAVVLPTPATPQPAPAVAPVEEVARIVIQAVPVYPQRAIQMRRGTNQDQKVRLKVLVGEQGQALNVSVIEGVAGTYGFDEAAIEAAKKSTYSPSTRDGKPVRGWTPEIGYRFLKRN